MIWTDIYRLTQAAKCTKRGVPKRSHKAENWVHGRDYLCPSYMWIALDHNIQHRQLLLGSQGLPEEQDQATKSAFCGVLQEFTAQACAL